MRWPSLLLSQYWQFLADEEDNGNDDVDVDVNNDDEPHYFDELLKSVLNL